MINAYRQWEKAGCSKEWAQKNYLQYRALNQASKIREQLESYSLKINYPNCEKYFIDLKQEKQMVDL